MLLELLMRHEDMHALCVRQVAATLRGQRVCPGAVAMAALGADGAFHIVPGAMEIVRKATASGCTSAGRTTDEN